MKMTDYVNSPPHYNSGNIECIDAIEESMTSEAFKGYLKGNIQKYMWRYESKKGLQDVLKAQWYLNRLVKTLEKEETLEDARTSPPSNFS
jgi:hypothetical protein|tara:strand:+ start:76 stop:345 length:270 start_codon:yes stop_codon:yes gene_type:complete